MKVLLIGYGSIAKKHIAALRELVTDVEVYALRSSEHSAATEEVINIKSIEEAGDISFSMVCNPTSLHADALSKLAALRKPVFLEKPPFQNWSSTEQQLVKQLNDLNVRVYCAFNLRFLECLLYLKKTVDVSEVNEVNIYCGSYLPEWRPRTDYRNSYSANERMGGGVHLDLIHELDYATWIFGIPLKVTSEKTSHSSLKINAADSAHFALQYAHFTTHIQLNYYRRDAKRSVEVVTSANTLYADLMNNTVRNLTHNTLLFESEQRVKDTYEAQMSYFLKALNEKESHFHDSFSQAIETLQIALQ